MYGRIIIPILSTLILTPHALAGDPAAAAGLTVAYTLPKVTVTHYSATPRGGRPCRLEGGNGGPDSSPSGVRPLSARIDKPGNIKGRTAVLAAVPQRGGNSSMYGCFFALPDAYPGKLFFAGDRYGKGSNGKWKTDISSSCNSIVNKTLRSSVIVYNCKGAKGNPAARQVKRDPPAPPKRVVKNDKPVFKESYQPVSAPAAKKQRSASKRSSSRNRAPASQSYDWAKWIWQNQMESGG